MGRHDSFPERGVQTLDGGRPESISAFLIMEAVRHYDEADIVSPSDSDVADLLDFLERLD
ncbi:MAG: hypothetical protein ACPGVZ_17790 [Myxococcota bacterium]